MRVPLQPGSVEVKGQMLAEGGGKLECLLQASVEGQG